jgi:hypothetical protein
MRRQFDDETDFGTIFVPVRRLRGTFQKVPASRLTELEPMTNSVSTEDSPLALPDHLLRNLTVASPCPESWDRMHGDDRRRYCERCRLDVYNLSAMTTAEATALVERRTDRLCVRFVRSHDGKVMTSDCPHRAVARRRGIFAALALLLVGLLYGGAVGGGEESIFVRRLRRVRPLQPIVDRIFGPPEIMGDVCPAPVPGKSPQAAVPPPAGTNPSRSGTSTSSSPTGPTPTGSRNDPRSAGV